MEKLWKLKRNTLVLVCDGRKAMFLVNANSSTDPALRVLEVMEAAAGPGARERPGRRPDRVGVKGDKSSLSAMEPPDLRRREKDQFVLEIAARLERKVREDQPASIVIAAAPDILGELRKHMPDSARNLIEAEFAKDLTHMSVGGITAALLDV